MISLELVKPIYIWVITNNNIKQSCSIDKQQSVYYNQIDKEGNYVNV